MWNHSDICFAYFGPCPCVQQQMDDTCSLLETSHCTPGPSRTSVGHSKSFGAQYWIRVSRLMCKNPMKTITFHSLPSKVVSWMQKVSFPGLQHGKFLCVCVQLVFRLFIYCKFAVDTRTVPRGPPLFLHRSQAAPSLPSVLWSFSTLCRAAPFITEGSCEEIKRRFRAK